MADTDLLTLYDQDVFDKPEHTTDLHTYFMSQFNMELENKPKKSKEIDTFQYGNEESYNFQLDWDQAATKNNLEINSNCKANDEGNIKEVLLDLDNIDFESTVTETNSYNRHDLIGKNNYDYIDDESLLDELCREESDTSAEVFSEDCSPFPKAEGNHLPSMETAFSNKYCNYNGPENAREPQTTAIENLNYYCYPNSVLYNIENEKHFTLPDTPTSCTEFNFDRADRKVSVSESIDSDLQSSYYDDSETLDEDDLFINLDDFGFQFDKPDGNVANDDKCESSKQLKEKFQGDRVCQWEQCLERYPTQSLLVEHIERAHVNSYKGDEFSCLWGGCPRGRRPFNARYKLLIHMRVHSGHKPNRCHHPGCGKAFSRLENLKIHVRSHTGERPYACAAPACRKAFSNSSDRAKHQRTHFNARPYACGAAGCGKRYTDPSSLRKHVKSHPHLASAPRLAAPRAPRRAPPPAAPASPARAHTLRCIRDKIAVVPRLMRLQ